MATPTHAIKVLDDKTVAKIFLGNLVAIPEKIIKEIPLPNFFSVINSPIKIITKEAAVKIKTSLQRTHFDAIVIIFCIRKIFKIPMP